MAASLKVLWATDGSECAQAAVPLIRSLVLPATATLDVLTVAPEPMLSGARPDPVYFKPWTASERKAARHQALALAQRSADQLAAAGVEVRVDARFGHPIQEILRAADHLRADLLVLGAKGHSDLKLMLLGSVAQGVLQYARRPVLIVRPGSTGVRTAVVGIDGSTEALNALRFLQGLSLDAKARIILARVVQLISARSSLSRARDDAFGAEVNRLNTEAIRAAGADIRSALRLIEPKRSVTEEMPRGEAGAELLDLAQEHSADIIVLGSRKPSRARKYLLGSTAAMVAREAPTSVLVVR